MDNLEKSIKKYVKDPLVFKDLNLLMKKELMTNNIGSLEIIKKYIKDERLDDINAEEIEGIIFTSNNQMRIKFKNHEENSEVR